MLAHEWLLCELRMEIARCARGGPERVDQLEILQKTLAHITRRFNALPPPGAGGADTSATAAAAATATAVVGGGEVNCRTPSTTDRSLQKLRPKREAGAYISPFPEYISTEPPAALNDSLERLLAVRPPPIALVPKICYNLLASPIAPTVHTFNIIMRGLTRLRHNSLAYVLFNALASGGLGPKARPNEGTIAVLLNLSIKNGDYEGFLKVTRIYCKQKMRRGIPREQRRRPKAILEAMIHGHARFGNSNMVSVALRALARECPESPEPSLRVLTSILRLRTEMSDLPEGIRTWNRIMDLDAGSPENGTGEKADLRAFYQMYRLCVKCRNEPWKAALVEFALQRGWSEHDISRQPCKVKGVSFRRGNKAPDYFTSRGRFRPEEDEGGKRELLQALDNARMAHLKEGAKQVALLKGRVFKTLRSQLPPPKPPSPPPPPSPPNARTHTWKEIISRHMKFKAHAREVRNATRTKPRKRKRRKKEEKTEGKVDKETEKTSD